MIVEPTVGAPTIDGGGCAFSADLDTPACGRPETWHVIGQSDAWGVVWLGACEGHHDIARAAVRSPESHRAEGCDGVHIAPEGATE